MRSRAGPWAPPLSCQQRAAPTTCQPAASWRANELSVSAMSNRSTAPQIWHQKADIRGTCTTRARGRFRHRRTEELAFEVDKVGWTCDDGLAN
jgi:hypothetical protein